MTICWRDCCAARSTCRRCLAQAGARPRHRAGAVSDDLVLVARPGHSAGGAQSPSRDDLLRFPRVAPRPETPARAQFDRFFGTGDGPGAALVECSSLILMRELLRRTDHVGCISRMQASAEIDLGALVALDVVLQGSAREIGLTTRADWLPTPAQARMVAILREGGGLT
ncbi:MAG: LysR substrate-binding domain-containing protein [Paracoccaceae bacterium]